MAIFTLPPEIPPVVEYAKPKYGAEPIIVNSRGYRYTVTGNTFLPTAEIEKTLAAAKTPNEAVNDLFKAYQRTGYPLVAVTGDVETDSVAVNVIEGMFTEVNVPHLVAPFFRGLQDKTSIKKSNLIRRQIMAGLYADRSGKQVHLNVGPAPNPYGSTLTGTETDKPDYFPLSGSASFGNYGSRYTSGYVAGGSAVLNLGHGLQLNANILQGLPGLRTESLGSNYYQNGMGASAVTPYGVYGVSASWTHFRLGQITSPYYPDGNITLYQLTGMQLLFADDSTRVVTNESANREKFNETILDAAYTLVDQQYNFISAGATINHSLTLDGNPGNLSTGITFNLGISNATGTLAENTFNVPTPHFKYIDLSAGYVQGLPKGFQATLSTQMQISASTLPSQQQWVLGGFSNLTAWEPGVVAGDSGYTGQLEVDAPTYTRFKTSATIGAFVEVGGSTLRDSPSATPPWQFLSDGGLSLKVNLPYQFSVTSKVAIPFVTKGFNSVAQNDLNLNRMSAFFVAQKVF